jgi:ABC-type transporter Mla maintaining outer membrane lipid asymmetry ATPase subunit MlaF
MDHLAILTSGLTRNFGELTAVNSLNLQVPQGSVYGFLGPNGAGKTTTIRLLLGLIRLHAGHIQVFGRPFIKERHSLLKQIGALVESPSIYNHLTGRENLEITRRPVLYRHAPTFRISMTVIGLLLINADWARFYPWTLPALILNRSLRGSPIITELLLIGIGSVVIALLGAWNITRRDVL